jgi:hypothetical protein
LRAARCRWLEGGSRIVLSPARRNRRLWRYSERIS